MQKLEIIKWLKKDYPKALFKQADSIQKKFCKDIVHLRAIIEFSNFCKKNCSYCGLRKNNKKLCRYRIDVDQIYKRALKAFNLGYKTIVLQSGEDDVYSNDLLCWLIGKIKKNTDCALTLSLGEKSFKEYKRLKEAGADRYLLKFETSDRLLFKKVKPNSSFESRLQCVRWLRELGYQSGSGNIIGLPGQTIESLADDILLIKELNLDMVGVGPFIPHPETPLADKRSGSADLTLKVIALIRILTKNVHLPVTTALASLDKNFVKKSLFAGANVIMSNLTPLKYKKLYQVYPGKFDFSENNYAKRIIKETGKTVGKDRGDSLRL